MSVREQVVHPSYQPISECIGENPVATDFDVIVIGSGYGGAIAAARWAAARPGARICLLERGAELLPGMYPATFSQAQQQVQVHTDGANQCSIGRPSALLDLRVNEDVGAIVGCGLGGTSLINANVALEVNRAVFSKTRTDGGAAEWPKPFCDDPHLLDPYYRLSREKLGARPYHKKEPLLRQVLPGAGQDTAGPHRNPSPPLNKFEALKVSAAALGTHASSPPINVNMIAQTNWAGVEQPACTNCGDCCSGCNVGAKNTTLMNYLPFAAGRGVKIYNSATVDFVAQTSTDTGRGRRWQVQVSKTPEQFGEAGEQWTFTATTVIVAAGTLGTAAIMQRSAQRQNGLALSSQLGQRFSGNGDVLAFGYNTNWDQSGDDNPAQADKPVDRRRPINAVGLGENRTDAAVSPGPCITGVIDLRDTEDVRDGLVIEEGVIPGAVASILPAAFLMAATQQANFTRYGVDQAKLRLNDVKSLAEAVESSSTSMNEWSFKGPVARTQTYLVMSMDDSAGTLKLSDNGQYATIDWPGAGSTRTFERDNILVAHAVDAVQGQFMPFPLWDEAFGNKVISVHPLGGCCMGDTSIKGVVNDRCEVFNPEGGIYEGLYICDGSVLPGSIGVNPLLTICAITERACDFMLGMDSRELDPYQADTLIPIDTGGDSHAIALAGPANPDWAQLLSPTTRMQSVGARLKSRLLAWLKIPGILFTALLFGLASYLTRTRRAARKLVETRIEALLWKWALRATTVLLSLYQRAFSPGFFFAEIMQGFVARPDHSLQVDAGQIVSKYDIFRQAGEANGDYLTLSLSMQADCVQAMIESMQRGEGCEMAVLPSQGVEGDRASDAPFIDCPLLGQSAVNILGGTFRLFNCDQERTETWLMEYTIQVEGYFIYGRKHLHCDDDSHWWTDLTNLEVEIYHWDGQQPPVRNRQQLFALGKASLNLQDFIRQASTFRTPGGDQSRQGRWVRWILKRLNRWSNNSVDEWLGRFYLQSLVAQLSAVVFRSYGGLLASMNNFTWEDAQQLRHRPDFPRPLQAPPSDKPLFVKTADGSQVRLTRYPGASQASTGKGNYPIIIAPGMGVNASSFATPTVAENLVEYLTWGPSHTGRQRPDCDVWLFDYRASADSGSSTREFSIDDIAQYDWNAAIDKVLDVTGASQVQIVAHCVGSMSLLMGLLRGWIPKQKVASIISSQLTLHPVTNWLNNAKADGDIVRALQGLEAVRQAGGVIDMNPIPPNAQQPSGGSGQHRDQDFDRAIDLVCYKIPAPPHEQCNSPVCNRIFAIYGPSYLHSNLNRDTHLLMGEWFKAINLKPFEQLSKMIELGYVVDKHGENTFFAGGEPTFFGAHGDTSTNSIPELDLPITFLAGALNLEFLPQTSQRTYDWLCAHNPAHNSQQDPNQRFYRRHVFERYGHMDLFIGKRANRDIFPYIWKELTRHRSLAGEASHSGVSPTADKHSKTDTRARDNESTVS